MFYLMTISTMFGFFMGIFLDLFKEQPVKTAAMCFALSLIWPLVLGYALHQRAKRFLDYRSILKDKDGR